jgi:NAD(P)-dependent dehydrogenase (short-subunit alcohol dehydrogenase family)
VFERIGARLPVGRIGRPEEIAEAYLYPTKTGFSTGETIVIEGGALRAPRRPGRAARKGGRTLLRMRR